MADSNEVVVDLGTVVLGGEHESRVLDSGVVRSRFVLLSRDTELFDTR